MNQQRISRRLRGAFSVMRLTTGILLAFCMKIPLCAQEAPKDEVRAQGKVATGEESKPDPGSADQVEKKSLAGISPRKAKGKARLKKKSPGDDYETSRYLFRSTERNIYRFDEDGNPILSGSMKKKKAKGSVKKEEEDQGEAGLGVSLGSQQPKKMLKKISFEDDSPAKQSAAEPGDHQQSGMSGQGGQGMDFPDNQGQNSIAP